MKPPLERIDPDVLMKWAADDEETMLRLLRMFRSLAPDMYAALDASLAARNASDTARHAHTLKGSLALIGATGLTDALHVLECDARRGSLPPDPGHRAGLAAEFGATLNEIDAYVRHADRAAQPDATQDSTQQKGQA